MHVARMERSEIRSYSLPDCAEPVINVRAQLRSSSGAHSRDPLAPSGLRHHPGTPLFFSTKHAPPALRMRLQRSSAAGRVSAPIRT